MPKKPRKRKAPVPLGAVEEDEDKITQKTWSSTTSGYSSSEQRSTRESSVASNITALDIIATNKSPLPAGILCAKKSLPPKLKDEDNEEITTALLSTITKPLAVLAPRSRLPRRNSTVKNDANSKIATPSSSPQSSSLDHSPLCVICNKTFNVRGCHYAKVDVSIAGLKRRFCEYFDIDTTKIDPRVEGFLRREKFPFCPTCFVLVYDLHRRGEQAKNALVPFTKVRNAIRQAVLSGLQQVKKKDVGGEQNDDEYDDDDDNNKQLVSYYDIKQMVIKQHTVDEEEDENLCLSPKQSWERVLEGISAFEEDMSGLEESGVTNAAENVPISTPVSVQLSTTTSPISKLSLSTSNEIPHCSNNNMSPLVRLVKLSSTSPTSKMPAVKTSAIMGEKDDTSDDSDDDPITTLPVITPRPAVAESNKIIPRTKKTSESSATSDSDSDSDDDSTTAPNLPLPKLSSTPLPKISSIMESESEEEDSANSTPPLPLKVSSNDSKNLKPDVPSNPPASSKTKTPTGKDNQKPVYTSSEDTSDSDDPIIPFIPIPKTTLPVITKNSRPTENKKISSSSSEDSEDSINPSIPTPKKLSSDTLKNDSKNLKPVLPKLSASNNVTSRLQMPNKMSAAKKNPKPVNTTSDEEEDTDSDDDPIPKTTLPVIKTTQTSKPNKIPKNKTSSDDSDSDSEEDISTPQNVSSNNMRKNLKQMSESDDHPAPSTSTLPVNKINESVSKSKTTMSQSVAAAISKNLPPFVKKHQLPAKQVSKSKMSVDSGSESSEDSDFEALRRWKLKSVPKINSSEAGTQAKISPEQAKKGTLSTNAMSQSSSGAVQGTKDKVKLGEKRKRYENDSDDYEPPPQTSVRKNKTLHKHRSKPINENPVEDDSHPLFGSNPSTQKLGGVTNYKELATKIKRSKDNRKSTSRKLFVEDDSELRNYM